LYVVPHDLQARKVAGDFALFADNVEYFPSKDTVFYKIEAKSNEITGKRLSVIEKLLYGDNLIVVTSIEALLSRLAPPENLKKALKTLRVGDVVDLSELASLLVSMGYERVDMIEGKGQFSVRGGIIDFFPVTEEKPYRIELFDDEIDSIRIFDIISQRTEQVVDSVRLFCARELVITQEVVKRATTTMAKELASQEDKLKAMAPDAAKRLSDKINEYIECFENNIAFSDIDIFLNYLFPDAATLLDYIGEALIVLDEPDMVRQAAESVRFEFEENFKALLERGEVLPGQSSLMAPYEEIAARLQSGPMVIYNPFMKSLSGFSPKGL